jgi:hypothetical protein
MTKFTGKDQVEVLVKITSSLEHGFSSSSRWTQKWSAIKAVFKGEKIETFKIELGYLKSTLILVRQETSRLESHTALPLV